MCTTKFYLVRYDFYSSLGGYTNDIDIIDVSYEREPLEEYVRNEIEVSTRRIEEVNGVSYDEYEFNPEEFQWEITYAVDGMTIYDETVLKIIEREE